MLKINWSLKVPLHRLSMEVARFGIWGSGPVHLKVCRIDSHWWSLQSDWLSAVWFIHESHFFFKSHTCSKSRHPCSKFRHSSFKSHHFCSILHHFCFEYKRRYKTLFVSTNRLLGQINIGSDWIVWFHNGCKKVAIELRVVQFWSEIIRVISNHAYDFRPNCTTRTSIHPAILYFVPLISVYSIN